MPRPPRIQYSGAWHHVMNRGVDRMIIFRDRTDRIRFLGLLEEAVSKFGIEVHAYCLMGNHYHLLVRTPDPNLDLAIHHIAGLYARIFNTRHGRDGPLFRSRYKSLVVESESYLAAVTRYIHRNPLEVGVRNLARYEWSSFGAYVGYRQKPSWLSTTKILETVGDPAKYDYLVTSAPKSAIEQVYERERWPLTIGEIGEAEPGS
ncbi:MAG: transposase [Acidimicrobiia bacterium]|nr:transposase [Acidimicrobiia bacterium]